MSVRVAVIGAGIMGEDHIRILAEDLPGTNLQVVCDADGDRARSIGEAFGAADITTDPVASIQRKDVDAVLIASPDETHADLTLASISAGKPVLCEKPLAPTAQDCLRIVEAEVKIQKRLVQTGFMRRFDQPYIEMKEALDSGALGNAVIMHNFHRNMVAPHWLTGQMAISNSATHEFDIVRFVLGTEYRAIMAFQGEKEEGVAPVMMVLETAKGQIVSIEVNNNAAYGYEVRSELAGEKGSIDLATPVHTKFNTALQSAKRFAEDWRPRFADAYRLQSKAWLKGIETGIPAPNAAFAWDGYCATVTAEAGVNSLVSGVRVAIETNDMPQLYTRSSG